MWAMTVKVTKQRWLRGPHIEWERHAIVHYLLERILKRSQWVCKDVEDYGREVEVNVFLSSNVFLFDSGGLLHLGLKLVFWEPQELGTLLTKLGNVKTVLVDEREVILACPHPISTATMKSNFF